VRALACCFASRQRTSADRRAAVGFANKLNHDRKVFDGLCDRERGVVANGQSKKNE
jgi:hypothetical protein